MTPDERKKALDAYSLEKIDEDFHRGHLWADQRNALLRAKARRTIDDMLGGKGYMEAVLAETVKNIQEGWNTTKQAMQAIPDTKTKSSPDATLPEDVAQFGLNRINDFKNVAKTLWGQAQIVGSMINALGTVNGQVVENWYLGQGLSPGAAKMMGFAADAGTALLPVGLAYRTGVQATGLAMRGVKGMVQARRIAKAGEMVTEAQKMQQEAAAAMEQVETVIKQGLELEGVKLPEFADISISDAQMKAVQSMSKTEVEKAVSAMKEQAAAGREAGEAAAISVGPKIKNLKTGETRSLYEVEKEAAVSDIFEGRAVIVPPASSAPPTPPPDARSVFEADLKAFRRTMKDLTETQTHAQTRKMADRLGLTLEDLNRLVPGAALNEKEMLAYLNALDPQIEKMYELAEAARLGGAPETTAFMQHMSSLLGLMPKFRGAEVTAGRTVEILKESPPMKAITDMLVEMDPESIAKGDFRGAASTLAQNIVDMKSAPNKGAGTVALLDAQQRAQVGLWDGFNIFYKNLLLMMPRGMIRDMLGNSISAATNLMETQLGGIFSASKEGLELGSAWYKIKGMHLSLGQAMKNYAKTWTTEGGLDVAGGSVFDADKVPQIPGPIGSVISAPGTSRRAADNWFKTLFYGGSIYEQAIRQGHEAGLKGAEFADFVSRRSMYPTNGMKETAKQEALYQTFQNELGTFGKWVRQGLQWGPLALMFPFVKTAIDLKKWAWNRTPGLQLMSIQLWNEIAEGGVKADMAIGRLTWSTLQAMWIYQLAQENMITGSGPVDAALNRGWRMTNEPYSLKTPWGQVPFSNLDPETTVFGTVADFAQVHNQLADPLAEQTAMAIVFSIMHNMTQNTWWPTMNRLVDVAAGALKGQVAPWHTLEVVFDPAVTLLAGPVGAAASLISGGPKEALLGALGGPVSTVARQATDPIRRQTRNIVDQAINQVPGYSKTLHPMRDDLGRPIVPPQAVGAPWTAFFNPITVRGYETDRRAKVMQQLKVGLPPWPDRVGMQSTPALDAYEIREPKPGDRFGADLTQAELMRRDEIYKELVDSPKLGLLPAIIDRPEFTTDPNGEPTTPVAKKGMIERYLHEMRSAANAKLAIESPTLVSRIMQSDYAKVAPLMGPKAQDQTKEQLGLSLQLWEKMAPDIRDNVLRWGMMPDEVTTP